MYVINCTDTAIYVKYRDLGDISIPYAAIYHAWYTVKKSASCDPAPHTLVYRATMFTNRPGT